MRKLRVRRSNDRGMFDLYPLEISGSFYSWRGGAWIVTASLIFSLVAYLLLTDKELSLLDQGEMLFTLAEVIIPLGVVMSVTSASSSISGEIESGTFESLLLTPVTQTNSYTETAFSSYGLAHFIPRINPIPNSTCERYTSCIVCDIVRRSLRDAVGRWALIDFYCDFCQVEILKE